MVYSGPLSFSFSELGYLLFDQRADWVLFKSSHWLSDIIWFPNWVESGLCFWRNAISRWSKEVYDLGHLKIYEVTFQYGNTAW